VHDGQRTPLAGPPVTVSTPRRVARVRSPLCSQYLTGHLVHPQ
jgi:hypothetical protein